MTIKCYTPAYYHAFQCLAGRCPDSCCKEWEVDVDSASAAFYRSLPGSLGDRLRQVLKDTPDGTVMTIDNGRCPMWRKDALCEIHCQLGHDALCSTCREYPRMIHDYGSFVERGLELSCPEAARLIFESPFMMECSVEDGGYEPDYDTELMETLRKSRDEIVQFLKTSSLPLPQKLAVLLLYAHEVQSQIDGGTAANLSPLQCLADAHRYAQAGDFSLIPDFFLRLEILTPQWEDLLRRAVAVRWRPDLLSLARYGIYRYWLQAVSDYDLICRVKFIIISCILVGALDGDTVCAAQLFSKEIENDPDNMERILDAAYTEAAFTDANLLGLLLQ